MVVDAKQQSRKQQTPLDSNTGTMIDVELVSRVHVEKCLDVVPNMVLCAEEGVSRSFRPQPLNVAPLVLAPTTSVIAGGVGASLPARPAEEVLSLSVVLPTLPRRQRRVAVSRQNSTAEIAQMTFIEAMSTMWLLPLSTKNPSLLLISEILTPGKYFARMSAGLSLPATFGHLDASFSNQPESQRSATSMGLILSSPVLW